MPGMSDLFTPLDCPPRDLHSLLDRVLKFACDIDYTILLANELGWTIQTISGPHYGPPTISSYDVLLVGRRGPVRHERWMRPESITIERRTAYASHQSLYGALVLALLRGLARERQCDVETANFERTGK